MLTYCKELLIYTSRWALELDHSQVENFILSYRAFSKRKGSILTGTSFTYLLLQVVNSTPHVLIVQCEQIYDVPPIDSVTSTLSK